jgi:hypothetical protein
MFWATTHAEDAIAHEMKNAVHGSRAFGAARIAGPQTRSVNRLIMAASALAATRGKIENSTPRPQARSRVATALRMVANSLHHTKDYLDEFFRHIIRKLGKSQAITATAFKLPRMDYQPDSTKESFNESIFRRCEDETTLRPV